ncbi:DUF1353 domain-containing protein [Arenicella xantha]|uniref:Uncharacterized protein DUF1353 n=1 Tax=Arenicella xantha TaxID=644221 RepID=A0A395JPG0_9GAMM|nr:DUF1353 domain-containing protein [Arenicella xantha]RBP53531.1 uncharacterized protein DUF1353 [Arenicella xantha]
MIKIKLFAFVTLFCFCINVHAQRFEYEKTMEFKEECENCLLSPFLAVAIFHDQERDGRKIGVVLSDYFYCHEGSNEVYRVPTGFETDFLSIPNFITPAIRSKDFMEAGVVHDWLYAVGEKGKKKHADTVFRDMLGEQDASRLTQAAMYGGVKYGGKSSYGTRPEIPIFDLEKMVRVTPSPIQKPKKAAYDELDCSNQKAFTAFRKQHAGKKAYTKVVEDYEVKGFKLVED